MSNWGSKKSSKTISPPGEPDGNTMHIVHYVVSPEIALMGDCSTQVSVV
jgi:hypothetical protein